MSVEALEARLRDHPGDWEAWLVYGDHLHARGDARAELIRLEAELAQVKVDGARKRRLVGESRALSKRHEAEWRGVLSEGVALSWRNGFVVGAWLPWDAGALATLDAFLASAHGRLLTTIGFETRRPREEEPVLELLRAVASRAWPTVHTLSFAYGALGLAGARLLRGAASFATVRHLDLRYCELGDEGLRTLMAAGRFPRLRTLSLQHNALTASGLEALQAAELPALRELDLRYNRLGPEGARALSTLELLPRLEQLFLNGVDVGREGVRVLATSPRLPPVLRRVWSGR